MIVDIQESIVHPVICEFLSQFTRFRTAQFHFMMREDRIFSAAMNINLLAQIFFAHDGALNMRYPGRPLTMQIPERLASSFGLPEYEIERIFLLVLSVGPSAHVPLCAGHPDS